MSGLATRRLDRSSVPTSRDRIAAVDVARFVAIVGMMTSHLVASMTTFPGAVLTSATHGFPSTLFGVVAGVATVIAADRPMRAGRPAEAIGAQLARGLAVALIGVVIALMPTFVAVVLVPLGVAILVAAPLLRASIPVLAAVAAGLAIGGPLLISSIAAARAESEVPPVQSALDDLLFIGVYPVLTWIVFVIVGMLIGRALLAAIDAGRAAALGLRLAVSGAVAVIVAVIVDGWYVTRIAAPRIADGDPSGIPGIVEALRSSGYGTPHGTGWDAILIAAPHTGTTLDLLRTVGGAAFVIGVVLLLVGGGAARSIPTKVVAAAGGAAFTIYVLHIVTTSVLTIAAESGAIEWGAWDGPALAIDLVLLVGLGAVLAATGRRGPFETIIRAAGRFGARVAGRRPRGR